MPKTIADLRRDRKAAADKMTETSAAIATLEEAGTAADAAEMVAAVAAFDAAKAAFDGVSATLARAESVEAAQAAAAVGDKPGNPAPAAATTPAVPADPALKGVSVGFVVGALARAKGDRDKAVADLEAQGHGQLSAALSGATEAAGGVTIPRPMAEEMIGLLRARVVVRASGARTFPMPAGQIRHAKQIASATASYGAENAAIAASEPAFDKLDQSFKILTGLVPIGNALLRHTGVQMAQLVRDDLLTVMALREDLAFLRGDGLANTPKGLRNWMLTANWPVAAVAASAAAADLALRRAVSRVEDANVAMTAPGCIMRASTKNWLASLRDAVGFLLYPSINDSGTLLGFPIRVTSQVPNNLGGGGNETEVYFGDFAEAMIGDSMVMTLSVSTEAGYHDGTSFVSAYQNDLTLIRAVSEHDFAPAHDVAFAGFNATSWSL